MGLFDKLKRKPAAETKKAPAEPPVAAEGALGTVCSPVAGRAAALTDVPDPVFAGGVMGAGCAVWPSAGVAYAPVSGTVSAAMGHAVGITGDSGAEVLVHVGIDTVDMGGAGFEPLVAQGDHVSAGDACIRFDRAAIAAAGHPDCVVVAVSNSAAYSSVQMAVEPGAEVKPGQALLSLER